MASVAQKRGQYPELIREGVGDAWTGAFEVVDVRTDAPFPSPERVAGIIVSGSSHSVTEQAAWMKRAGAFLRTASEEGVPVLGLCFGHQLIADAFGGEVQKNPRGREIGTVTLQIAQPEDAFFAGCAHPMKIQATHVDSVVALPERARVMGSTSLDPHAAYSIGERVRCVQLHPELDHDIIREYVEARAEIIESEGLSLSSIRAEIAAAPDAPKLLQNFARAFLRR